MSEGLTTRDVFQQVDARLGRVEDDLRATRADLGSQIAHLRQEVGTQIDQLRDELNARFDRLYGLLVSVLVGVGALVIAVAGLWLKA
jgi:hypothetical protein